MGEEITIREMQQIESDILRSFSMYCEENGLRYYAAYGTLLGAIRHKGFIPWDDDVDVMMPRKDYEQLIGGNNNIEGRYSIISRKNKADFPYAFAKCIDNYTEMEEMTYRFGKIGVYIDIFPLDGMSNNAIKRTMHFWKKRQKNMILTNRTTLLQKQ